MADAPDHAPATGLIAGRYELRHELGRGTTGRVYEALDLHLDRSVAIKVLDAKLAQEATVASRFEHEIRVTARLSHPGIVAVFESADSAEGNPCYVMSMARGITLEERLDRLRQAPDPWRELPLIDRLNLFLKILDVMTYAHSRGVVHRDLKPANIIIGTYGEVWILDWGLARTLREESVPVTVEEDPFDADEAADHGPSTAALEVRSTSRLVSVEAATVIMPGMVEDVDVSHTTGDLLPLPASEDQGRAITRPGQPGSDRVNRAGVAVPTPHPDTDHALRPGTDRQVRHDKAGTEPHATRTSSRLRVSTGRHGRSERLRTADPRSQSQRLARATHHGQVLGSPAYMSPEQARGRASDADQRTDVYSLGVILVELLCLHTPVEAISGDTLQTLLARVRAGERRKLADWWPEAPKPLQVISEWALAADQQDRYPTCDIFSDELRTLLSQLSASYAELEAQRLVREREAAWLPAGMWDFGASRNLGPFSLPSWAQLAEQVGQVHHPELGGVLVGGYGLQTYPLAVRPGDDVRVTIEIDVLKGAEVWIIARGCPPGPSYQFRVGAYLGRWILVTRSTSADDLRNPVFLTTKPLRTTGTTATADQRHRKVTIEMVGSRLTMSVDGQDPLEYHDLQPISVDMDGSAPQLAIATWTSQALVRGLRVERRRSPLMIPAHAVGGELLRQGLHRKAAAFYRTFLENHPDTAEAIEARFMRAMALVSAGEPDQAESELRDFLSDHLEHALAQDAIFELARLRLTHPAGGFRKAVQEVLAYQDSGDMVRTRFCLWMLSPLRERVGDQGLTSDLEFDLRLVRGLIKGSPDEAPLLSTIANVLSNALRAHLDRLLDAGDAAGLAAQRQGVRRLAGLGLRLSVREPRLADGYRDLVEHLRRIDDPAEAVLLLGRGEEDPAQLGDYVRNILALRDLGADDLILAVLAGDDLTPVEHLLRASLLRLHGDERAQADLEWCFRLTDVLETERTSLVILVGARLGCYGLGYLPWELVEDGLSAIQGDPLFSPLVAVAALLSEAIGDRPVALRMYTLLADKGLGFRTIAQTGQARLAA